MFCARFERRAASDSSSTGQWSGVEDALGAVGPGVVESVRSESMFASALTSRAGGDSAEALVFPDLDVVHWARLDNRAELLGQLGLVDSASTAEVLAAAYRSDGEACARRLRGAFSFVILDHSRQRVVAARDHFGLRPLLYWADDQALIVTTTGNSFRAMPGVAEIPSQRWIARHIAQLTSPDETPWPDVSSLAPAHALTWQLRGASAPISSRYHSFDYGGPAVADDEARHIAQYRACLEETIGRQTRVPGKLGVEISGGIDSSTILAMAVHTGTAPGTIEAMGFAVFEREPELLPVASEHCGVDRNHLLSSREVGDETIDRGLRAIGHPPEHATAFGHLALYTLSEQLDVRVLVSGFGGDEAVTNPADLALVELLLRRHPRLALKAARGNFATALYRGLRAERHRRQRPRHLAEAKAQLFAHSCLTPAIAATVDLTPDRHPAASLGARARTVNEWVIDGCLAEPFLSARTSHGAATAAAFGVEYRWPLLDVDLIATWLASPTNLKARDGTGRYLHRRAVDDLVPASVLWNPSKWMGAATHPFLADATGTARRLSVELHPAIKEVVDLERHLRNATTLDASPFTLSQQAISHVSEARRMRVLNRWLHDRYPR